MAISNAVTTILAALNIADTVVEERIVGNEYVAKDKDGKSVVTLINNTLYFEGGYQSTSDMSEEVREAARVLRDAVKRAIIARNDGACVYCGDTRGLCESVCTTEPIRKLVVTRHQALIDYLLEVGVIADGEYDVVAHVTPEVVKGRRVVGILPHSLSCLTESFTEVPLVLPAELRGKELSIQDMRQYAKPPVTYKVTVV